MAGDSYYGKRSNKRNRLDSSSVRKIRVICNDPDATDSSDDDEVTFLLRRRIVQEINLPYPEAEVSCQGSNNGDRSFNPITFPKKKKKGGLGVRRKRKSHDSEESVVSRASTVSEVIGGDGKGCENVGDEIQIQMLDFVSVEEGADMKIQMEVDSLFVNDYGEVFDDLSVLYDLPMCEFDGLDGLDPWIDLPKFEFDFELGNEELAWIEEPLSGFELVIS